MKNQLTIGIPVRNEEKTLYRFMESLLDSVLQLSKVVDIDIEILICLNGSTDNTEQIIDQYMIENSGKKINLRKIRSNEGKIISQQEIIRERALSGFLCFFDADVLLDKSCLSGLWMKITQNNHLQVVYAKVKPLCNIPKTIVERLQSAHYNHQAVLTTRQYFHGRGYILRTPELLMIKSSKQMYANDCKEHKRFELFDGPKVDDIFLSRIIAYKYGLKSIAEASNNKAIVYFVPPLTLKDFYYGQKRLMIEIHRLNLLFPEHNYIQKRHFVRKINYKQLFNLPMFIQVHLCFYHLFEFLIKTIIKLQIKMISFGIISLERFWIPLTSTKQFYGGKKNDN